MSAGESSGTIVVPGLGLRQLSGAAIRQAARTLAETGPLLRGVPAAQVADALGWRACDDQPYDDVVLVDTGWGVGSCRTELRLRFTEPVVEEISACLADPAQPASTAGAEFCRLLFTFAACELDAELGMSGVTGSGTKPVVRWRLADVTLQLWHSTVSVSLNAVCNDEADRRAEVSAMEARGPGGGKMRVLPTPARPSQWTGPGTAEENWARFGEALAWELAQLPEDSFLVLRDSADRERVTQFRQSSDDLRAEVSGEEFDSRPSLLSEQDREALAAAGFSAPGDFDTDACNWWRIVPVPFTADDYRGMAEAAITALRDVHRVPDPSALIYHAWGYASGHRLVDLPGVIPDPAKY